MEEICSLLGSASVMIAFFAALWIFRCRKSLRSTGGMFAIVILIYTVWNFITHATWAGYSHIMIHNVFIILTAVINAHAACRAELTVNLNRRKEAKPYDQKERRKR